ncbi:MAG: LPS export ABC transporter permease LptF [Lysobacteraceae bacterium]
MRKIDRYVLTELAGSFLASLVILAMVSLGGLLADLLSKIARGKVPAALLLSQLGLRTVDALPLLLPLALFLGVLLAIGRLYRDSEMAVLASVGLGPRALLRPLLALAIPVALLVGFASLWAAPAALELSKRMIDNANRSLLVVGLEPGRFIELPDRQSVVYLGAMSDDGSRFERLFVHAERDGRTDIVTARAGELFEESLGEERYLVLHDGFRVEGVAGQDDFRMMRFARNEIRVPDSARDQSASESQRRDSLALLRSGSAEDMAELHARLGAPLAALLLAVLALPLARTPPRSARYGALLLALLTYIVYQNLMMLGRAWLEAGSLPLSLGLWWLHLPLLALTLWLYRRDGRPAGGRR